MNHPHPRRGEVWWIAFDPSVGGEIQKTRPAVIVSNDESNRYLNRVQVIPLTSKTAKVYPAECLVQVGETQSKAIASQLTTAAKERLQNRFGILSSQDLAAVEQAIKVQLAL
jgi:mRNA interferase MazF